MKMNEEQKRVKAIFQAFQTPLILSPGGWGDELPDWFKPRIIGERLAMIDAGTYDKATDAEVTAYMFTASLAQPLTPDWSEITIYQSALQMPQLKDVLDVPKQLTEYQKMEVDHLKHQMRDSQIKREKENNKGGTMMEKVKILIEEREGKCLIGISKEGMDPFVKVVDVTMQWLLDQSPFIAGIKEIADKQWAVMPKRPAYVAPPETKPAATAAAVTAPKKAEKKAPGKKKPVEKPGETTTSLTPAKAEELRADFGKVEQVSEPKVDLPAKTEPVKTTEVVKVSNPESGQSYEYTKTTTVTQVPEPAKETIPAPAAVKQTRVSADDFQYRLAKPTALFPNGGPFKTIQEAMDAIGLDKATRPLHNRYDRLSKKLQAEILQEKKA